MLQSAGPGLPRTDGGFDLKNVTKQDLVSETAKSSGLNQFRVKEVAELFLDLVSGNLAAGKTIEIRGFGTFYTKERKPRPARNPRTGEVCPLGRRRVALFRFSSDVKREVAVPELQGLPLEGEGVDAEAHETRAAPHALEAEEALVGSEAGRA